MTNEITQTRDVLIEAVQDVLTDAGDRASELAREVVNIASDVGYQVKDQVQSRPKPKRRRPVLLLVLAVIGAVAIVAIVKKQRASNAESMPAPDPFGASVIEEQEAGILPMSAPRA